MTGDLYSVQYAFLVLTTSQKILFISLFMLFFLEH